MHCKHLWLFRDRLMRQLQADMRMQWLTAINASLRLAPPPFGNHSFSTTRVRPLQGMHKEHGCQAGCLCRGAISDLRAPAHKIVRTAAQVKHRLAACAEERGLGRHESCHHRKVVASTSPLHIMHRPLLHAAELQRQIITSPSP